jgi:hypothetical protein
MERQLPFVPLATAHADLQREMDMAPWRVLGMAGETWKTVRFSWQPAFSSSR